MNTPLRIYAEHAEEYAAAGLPAFPVDARRKRPAIRGWQDACPEKTRLWLSIQKLGDADGLGVLMGKPSGIVEVDVDSVGDAWVALAVERFGETPVTIKTASAKAKLWYRHRGEGRHIRPISGLPIDVLGAGFTIAPPTWRQDLATGYVFREGGLEYVGVLPPIKSTALDGLLPTGSATVVTGERNIALWRFCMAQARCCDDVEALIDVAETWSAALEAPLPPREVERCARSAWSYEVKGRNFLGLRKPQINEEDKIMDQLFDHPEAYTLFQMFRRWHAGRSSFAISPRAMSEAGSPPWSRHKIERARDLLLERGFIEELASPDKFRRKSGRYKLVNNYPISGHNHYTHFPLPPVASCPWAKER